jgi:hypothetical protein
LCDEVGKDEMPVQIICLEANHESAIAYTDSEAEAEAEAEA